MTEQIKQFRADHDAYGHEIMDYFHGEEVYEIIEREDGYMDASSGVHIYFADFADWWNVEQDAMNCLVPGRVLDLGCGAGRAELYLQSQGIEVVGIDNSPLAIEVCRQRGVKDARLIPVTKIGPDLGRFSNILMLGNNWGLMGSFKRARWFLHKFSRMTTPEARIIAVSNDIYQTDEPVHLAYQAWNRERGRMSGQIRMRLLCHFSRSPWFDYLMVSQEEMRAIAAGTGWKINRFLANEGQSGYVAVLEKIIG